MFTGKGSETGLLPSALWGQRRETLVRLNKSGWASTLNALPKLSIRERRSKCYFSERSDVSDNLVGTDSSRLTRSWPINSGTMTCLANAQVSRMSNKQRGTQLNKDQLSNGARSGSTSCDVQCFRQEPQKAILSQAVGHHTLAKSRAFERGWVGMALQLPIVWTEAFLIKIFCFFVIECIKEPLTGTWAQLGPRIVHLSPANSTGPGQSLERADTRKVIAKHRQPLIKSVHRGQLQKNHVQHVF